MLFAIKSSKIVCGETLLFLKGGNAMNEFKVPEGWEVGHKDGYYTKTIKVGNCTCIIHTSTGHVKTIPQDVLVVVQEKIPLMKTGVNITNS